ncbi:hypothetical protein APSETT444_006987 [Aspergillus pseudonomiae]
MRYEGIVDQAANNLMTSLRQQPVVHLTTSLQGFTADFIDRLVLEESATQDTAFNKGLLSDPPRWQELGKLRYLDAVIKESVRQLPSLSYNREVVTPPEGAIVAGYYIPPGTMMELHSEALRGDPGTYGEDVDNYRPARWLNVDPRQRWAMSQNLLPFSTSINNSPKVRVAWLELKKIIVLLLLKFNVGFFAPSVTNSPFD